MSEPARQEMCRWGFEVAGVPVVPDLSGAAWFPSLDLVAVADLHFEKGTSFLRRGLHLPPYDTKATLKALGSVIARYNPARVVALGDSFHDGDGPARLDEDDIAALRDHTGVRDWIWIFGNHDPITTEGLDRLGGRGMEALDLGGLSFRHEPTGTTGEVAGHLHPGAAVRVRGRRLRRRCFAEDGRVLILPAFGAYTGSLNVCDPAFDGLLRPDFRAHLLGRDQVYPVSSGKLKGDGF